MDQLVTITINGTEDAPTIAGTSSGAVTEDGTQTATGTLTASDVDTADNTQTYSVLTGGSTDLGTFGINAGTGVWTYTLSNAAVQGMETGDTATRSYTVRATGADGETVDQLVTITINGTNDGPQIVTDSGNSGAADMVYEAGLTGGSGVGSTTTLVGGTFTVSDPDGLDDIVSVTINSTTIAIANLGTNNVISGANGTLTVIAYDAGTGVATYTYQLTSPTTDVTGTETNVFTLTTFDGTVSSAQASITINIVDDTAVIEAKTDLIFANSNNDGTGALPGGTGIFDYNIGADGRTSYSVSNSDFSAITLAGTVGAIAITSPLVTFSSETATAAVFSIAFSYAANSTTGTLTFDKVNGTYTVELAAPIASPTLTTSSSSTGFTGYVAGTSTVDASGGADVVVAQLASTFFVQFTGISEPGAGTSANNLKAGTAFTDAFADGELFTQAAAEVTVSSSAAGVAGNSMEKGEVMDLDFFTANPTGLTSTVPTAQASAIFLKFDGISTSEDLVIILKLVSAGTDGVLGTTDDQRTTKAIIVSNSDIFKAGNPPPAGYGIVLDNNDGAVIIESNDYNFAGQSWVIEGLQVMTSVESITGSGVNLNSATGASGGSSSTLVAFAASDTDGDVLKISDIGFVSTTTTTQDANLSFSFTVVDADGDATATQVLDVTIEGSSTFTGTADAEVIQGSGGNDTLTGGADSDTFKWTLNETGADRITDFNLAPVASGGDVLDLKDLLVGEHATSGSLDALLNFSVSGSGTLITVVDTNADVAGNTAGPTILLANVSYAALQAYTGITGATEADIINKLLQAGNLKTDT